MGSRRVSERKRYKQEQEFNTDEIPDKMSRKKEFMAKCSKAHTESYIVAIWKVIAISIL